MKKYLILSIAFLIFGCKTAPEPSISFDFSYFTKPAENPILKSDSTFTFYCPVKKDTVRWQKADVFNPAAIVKDNKVYVLFRAEDNPKAKLGGRTSRIGFLMRVK